MPIRAEISSTSGVTAVVGGTGAAPVIPPSAVGPRIGRFTVATTASQGDKAVLAEGTAISADVNTLAVHQGNLEEKINGIVLVVRRPGLPPDKPPRYGIPIGNFISNKLFSLPIAGEGYFVTFAVNRDDDSAQGDELSLTVGETPPAQPTTIEVHYWVASPSVGATVGELNSVKADVSRIEQEVQAVQAAETSVPTGSDAEAQQGTGTANRLWSAARLRLSALSSITRAVIARVTGGFQLPPTQSANVLHLRSVNADNSVSVLDFHAGTQAPQGAGLAAWQATNLAGNLLATLAQFTFVPATSTTPGVLTYNIPLPSDGSITLQMLATSLQNLIAGKLDTSQVKARIESDPVVLSLQAFEADLRRERVLAVSLAWTQHASSAYFRFAESGLELPDPKAGDMIRFVVAAGTATFTTPWVSYADFRSHASSNGQPASSSNGTRFADGPNDNVYFFSRQGNLLLAASENIGDYSVSPQFSEIDLKPYARLSGPAIAESDLDSDLQSKIDNANASSVTEAEARRIADEEIAKNLDNVDVIARKPQRFSRPSLGEDTTATVNLGFPIGSTNFNVASITQDDGGAYIITTTPINSRSSLLGYEIRIGDTVLDFSSLSFEAGDRSNPDSWVSARGQPTLSLTADTLIEIIEPIGKENYVPGRGVTGYPLVKNEGDTVQSTFQQLGTVGLESAAVTAPKLAENAVTNRAILDEAVGSSKIHGQSPGSISATSLDDNRVPVSASGGWTTRPLPGSFHITQLIDASGPGISVPLSGSSHRTALQLLRPTSTTFFVLTDTANQTGLIAAEVSWAISQRSSNSIGFDQSASPATTVRFSGFIPVGDLRSANAYSASSTAEGVELDGVDISLGTTVLGRVTFWFAKNASDQLGIYADYVGRNAGTNYTFALGNSVVGEYIPSGS